MKNTFKLLLIFVFASITALAQDTRGGGVPQCWARDYECFIREYTKRIAIEPRAAENYYQRGVNLSKKFRYGEALKDFEKFIELKPKAPKGYYYRGTMLMYRANYVRAIADFDKAIALKPDFTDAVYSRGRSYFMLDKLKPALADYNRAVELEPEDLFYYVARGDTYRFLKIPELFEKDLKYALDRALKKAEAGRENSDALAQLAYVYFFKDDNYQAINYFTRAIDLDLDDFDNYYYRGAAYLRVGRADLALEDFNRGIMLTPEYAEFYKKRAQVYEKNGEREKARADRQKYEELSKM